MKLEGGPGTRRLRACTLAAVSVFLLAAPGALAAECDPVMPTDEVAAGMTGTGWTVSRGRTPEPFAVEVLGVLRDALAPGRDVILVEATSPAIARANGVWFGMSGSPVYVGGRLVGALSLGLGVADGPSAIAGLTPAEEMLRVLSYPSAGSARATSAAAEDSVELSPSVAREVARRTGAKPAEVGPLRQLKVPFSVSGLHGRGLRYVERFAAARGLGLVPYAGSSARLPSAAAPASLRPGENFAAVAAYGDITAAGVGTLTYVCNGRALAFGHPMLFAGETTLGANAAEAIAVVRDAHGEPFKIADIREPVGAVDQDRLAALRAVVGEVPAATAIRTIVSAPGLGARREGATDVVLPEMTPFATFVHVAMNVVSTYDAVAGGSSAVSWTIAGTRANGAAWSVSRSDVHASMWDIAEESGAAVAMPVDLIAGNPFEDVRVTSVRADVKVESPVREYAVRRVLVSVDGSRFKARRAVRARPGARIAVRVVLAPVERGRDRRVGLVFRLPRGVPPVGAIEIAGGARDAMDEECVLEGECEGEGRSFKSLDDILRHLARAPRRDTLTGKLRLGEGKRVRQKRVRRLPGVVRGGAVIAIGAGRRGGRGGGGEAVVIAGRGR